MVEASESKPKSWGRILGFAAALVIPALLAVLFWRTTPVGGGWATSGKASQADPAVSSGGPSAGAVAGHPSSSPEDLYHLNCARCHSANLEGTGTVPALKRPGWPYEKDRDLLVKIIHQGRGLTMPGFEGKLSNQQIEAVADFVQSQNGAAAR
jgi:mono/diheme cytochrome c family protein